MDKTINERLFEILMRAPRAIRKAAMEAEPAGDHGHGHDGGHGEGHGPMRGHGSMRGHGHGPMHGPGHGPEHEHGPGRPDRHNPPFIRERALAVIAEYEGGVRQKTLTEDLKINPSSVSELISKLENDGYVKRTVDPDDKRATLITLTELGEARTAEISDERNERLERAFTALTDDEKEQLIALLEKLTEED